MAQREGEGEYENGEFILTPKKSSHGDCFGKTILGFPGSTDYSVEARVRLESARDDAEAGIFVRSVSESNGQASGFSFRRRWYQRCYFVAVKRGSVCLYRQDYGETLLREYLTTADFTEPHLLKVAADKCDLTVTLDGEEVIRYTDEYYPYPYGRYGFKTVNGKAYFDDLTVEAIESEPVVDAEEETAEDIVGAKAPALLWVIIPEAAAVIVLIVLFALKRKKSAAQKTDKE